MENNNDEQEIKEPDMTGEITNIIGYTPSNRNTLTIEVSGQENYIGNHVRIGDTVSIFLDKHNTPPSIEGKQEAAIGGNCTLEELDAGSLFKHGDTIGLKTEYREDNGAIDAYIVGTGEMFWGGTNNPEDQRKIIVEIYNLKSE